MYMFAKLHDPNYMIGASILDINVKKTVVYHLVNGSTVL